MRPTLCRRAFRQKPLCLQRQSTPSRIHTRERCGCERWRRYESYQHKLFELVERWGWLPFSVRWSYSLHIRCHKILSIPHHISHITSHTWIACHTSCTIYHPSIVFSLSYVEEMGLSQWTAGSIPKFLTFQPPTQSHSLPCSLSFSFRFDGHPHGVCVQKAVSAPACRGS